MTIFLSNDRLVAWWNSQLFVVFTWCKNPFFFSILTCPFTFNVPIYLKSQFTVFWIFNHHGKQGTSSILLNCEVERLDYQADFGSVQQEVCLRACRKKGLSIVLHSNSPVWTNRVRPVDCSRCKTFLPFPLINCRFIEIHFWSANHRPCHFICCSIYIQ
jgi:hypothetical protein